MNTHIIRFVMFLLMASCSAIAMACRFTVREIGFSTLSTTRYTFVVADESLGNQHTLIKDLKAMARESNIKVVWLHPVADAEHPLMKKAKEQHISFPNAFLCGDREQLLPFYSAGDYQTQQLKADFKEKVLVSPLRKEIMKDVHRAFAYVLFIEGQKDKDNVEARKRVENSLVRIDDIIPLMPKAVDMPPVVLNLGATQHEEEKVLLWSIGLDSLPVSPRALVVYGRGRYMGSTLSKEEIAKETVYKYLAMVGADCECNLDRKWMLGTQIPLTWDSNTRQQLAKALTFDVDNPSILAEMSRIMTQEVESTGGSSISFCPETIDLEEAFGADNEDKKEIEENEDHTVIVAMAATILPLLIAAILTSIVILKRRQ